MLLSQKDTPECNRKKIDVLIDEEKFDYILLFDAFTFEYAQHWTGCNFQYLRDKHIPLISLDEYEYGSNGYRLDYYGYFIRKLPALLDSCDFLIRECPPAFPEMTRKKNNREFYYQTFGNSPRHLAAEDREAVRRRYASAFSLDDRVVMFTTSSWEMQGAYSFTCQNHLIRQLGPILSHYLADIAQGKIIMVHVGPEKWDLPPQVGNLFYIHYDKLRRDEFEALLQSSDLYLTYNQVSITLSKAAYFQVPSAVLNNDRMICFEKLKGKLHERPQWYQEVAEDVQQVYPFSASMFGWNDFLKNLFAENPYCSTFMRLPMFRYSEVCEKLGSLLYQKEVIQKMKLAQKEYFKRCAEIPYANDVMKCIAEVKV